MRGSAIDVVGMESALTTREQRTLQLLAANAAKLEAARAAHEERDAKVEAANARRGKAAEESLSRLAERLQTTTRDASAARSEKAQSENRLRQNEASVAQLSARLARSERDVVVARGLAQKLVDRLAATSDAKASAQEERDVMQQRLVAVEQRFNVKQQELLIRLAASTEAEEEARSDAARYAADADAERARARALLDVASQRDSDASRDHVAVATARHAREVAQREIEAKLSLANERATTALGALQRAQEEQQEHARVNAALTAALGDMRARHEEALATLAAEHATEIDLLRIGHESDLALAGGRASARASEAALNASAAAYEARSPARSPSRRPDLAAEALEEELRDELASANALADQRGAQVKRMRAKLVEMVRMAAAQTEERSAESRAQQERLAALHAEHEALLARAESEHAALATELEGQRALADAGDSGAAGEMLRKMKMAALAGGELHGVGLLGRLGDLGWTAPENERATAMAAGKTLGFIVVKRANDASQCVAFLKKHDLGRATFIILESLKKWGGHVAAIRSGAAAAKQNVPPEAQYLFNLISPSHARLDVAFAYALRFTLVAPSMEAATRVAYANGENKPATHRVVSAAGDCIIEKSGVLSGSAKAKKGAKASGSRRASILTSAAAATAALTFDPAALNASTDAGAKGVKKRLAALEKRVAAMDAQRRECCEIVASIGSEREAIAQLLPRLELEESKLQTEAATLTQERADCAANIAALAGHDELTAEEAQKLVAIDAALQELEAVCAAMAEESAELRASVKALQKTIRGAGSKQLVALKKKLAAAKASVADHRRALAKCKAQCKTSLKKAERAEAQGAGSKAEAERLAAEKVAKEDAHGSGADQSAEIRKVRC